MTATLVLIVVTIFLVVLVGLDVITWRRLARAADRSPDRTPAPSSNPLRDVLYATDNGDLIEFRPSVAGNGWWMVTPTDAVFLTYGDLDALSYLFRKEVRP